MINYFSVDKDKHDSSLLFKLIRTFAVPHYQCCEVYPFKFFLLISNISIDQSFYTCFIHYDTLTI